MEFLICIILNLFVILVASTWGVIGYTAAIRTTLLIWIIYTARKNIKTLKGDRKKC